MQNLSLWQRFWADTPKTERIIQVMALVLSLIVDHLTSSKYLASDIAHYLDGGLGGIALICQLAYEKAAEIKTIIADPGNALSMIPDLIEQFGQLKDAVTNPPVATIAAVEQAAAPLFQAQTAVQQPIAASAPIPSFVMGGIAPSADLTQQQPVAQQ